MHLWIKLGAIFGGLSVMLGAFGAHSLKNRLTEKSLATFQTGVLYQFIHSLALILVGILAILSVDEQRKKVERSGWFFAAGIVLFSGSLYTLALGGPRFLGPVTPLGGLSFMIGWFLFALAVPKK
ncbi:MAG: DUF423 domain-containing protein [Nitrospinaceae bacterium]|nr:DUF423 domain-containing protein [Nitrospinaceae bacterium]NIR55965.1 DUF423 domain-containing protein [Nitrospinaceae bacterium]NIS86408.1 DUF423 domain-containing protein [Nitrospinaceae bacterium]NIT83246.1 DUF423 domain-containing protein [Nitrospinaceae bacterium]NIU45453.1 DUF423 domain-containing protein [Nitrospinaceae bacterium]